MDYLFSDLEGHDDNTLYIIGNGFDCYHGIHSSYLDFYYWLRYCHKDTFIDTLEMLFPEKYGERNLLWKDFEMALETYNIDKLFSDTTKSFDIGWDQRAATAPIDLIHPIITDIPLKIKQWAKSFHIENVKAKLPLPANSLYLTFNYTDTLEIVYKIPSDRICHIHGRCNADDEIVVVGHHKMVPINQIENKDYPFLEEQGKKNIVKEMNSLYKDCHANIDKNKRFFSSLRNVDRVVILGHSMSDIDLPYLGRIRDKISKDAHWFISKHHPTDEVSIKRGVEELDIKECNRWIINF